MQNLNQKINTKLKATFFVLLAVVTMSCFVPTTKAATEVFLNPITTNIHQGEQFVVDLKLNQSKVSINVVDGVVVYDSNALQIKDIETEKSVLTFWTVEPKFDNKIGRLNFTGGVGNGYKGQDGQILRIIFVALKSGATKIDFKDDFAVYANDGKGTLINPWLKPLSLEISEKTDYRFVETNASKLLVITIAFAILAFVIIFILKKHVSFKK